MGGRFGRLVLTAVAHAVGSIVVQGSRRLLGPGSLALEFTHLAGARLRGRRSSPLDWTAIGYLSGLERGDGRVATGRVTAGGPRRGGEPFSRQDPWTPVRPASGPALARSSARPPAGHAATPALAATPARPAARTLAAPGTAPGVAEFARPADRRPPSAAGPGSIARPGDSAIRLTPVGR